MLFPQGFCIDHPGYFAPHFIEISRDCGKPVEDYAVDRRVIVGNDVVVCTDSHSFRIVDERDETGVKLAGQHEEGIALPDPLGSTTHKLDLDSVLLAEFADFSLNQRTVEGCRERDDIEFTYGFQFPQTLFQTCSDVVLEVLVGGAEITDHARHQSVHHYKLLIRNPLYYLHSLFLDIRVKAEVR